jgi:hypothetical protein|tara:strand:- start:710 stop:1396 length:687 start_codon:yes stop_codon:yes gene_type:complete
MQNAGGVRRRISINGNKFREYVNGKQGTTYDDTLNVVILNAAKISRSYYAGNYDASNPTRPTCWSVDTSAPAPEVKQEDRQARRCMDCPQNIKGSGAGTSRACRFAQRLAVAIENDFTKVYQLQLPATSVFGKAKEGKMPMRAYAQHLSSHNTPAQSVITECVFDRASAVPKLFFKAVRPLGEEEVGLADSMAESQEAIEAITMSTMPSRGSIFAEVDGFVYNPVNAN